MNGSSLSTERCPTFVGTRQFPLETVHRLLEKGDSLLFVCRHGHSKGGKHPTPFANFSHTLDSLGPTNELKAILTFLKDDIHQVNISPLARTLETARQVLPKEQLIATLTPDEIAEKLRSDTSLVSGLFKKS